MAKAKTARSTSSTVTPIDRVNSEVRKSPGTNGNVEEEIRRRAYELFEQRGRVHGYAQDDWIQAEAEVQARSANRTA